MALSTDLHPPRVLPVVLIADTSGSMGEHGKIDALNLAIREVLELLAEQHEPDTELRIAIVRCGAETSVHRPLMAVSDLSWHDLEADGDSPLGAALDLAGQLLADEALGDNAHPPCVVLIADGHPTDDFDSALAKFNRSELGEFASRLAIGVGPDADTDVLARFVGDSGVVVSAAEAADIAPYLAYATSMIGSRLRAASTGVGGVDAFLHVSESNESED